MEKETNHNPCSEVLHCAIDWALTNVIGAVKTPIISEEDAEKLAKAFAVDYLHVTIERECNHHFPNNGLLRSWCKFCGCEAAFDRTTNSFVVRG